MGILGFLVKNGRFFFGIFAVVALVIAYNNFVASIRKECMEEGIKLQAEKSREIMDKMQKDYDARVLALETKSTALAETLDKSNGQAHARIVDLNNQLSKKTAALNSTVYSGDGKAIDCKDAAGGIYLGSDFSRLWNQYNKEAIK